MANSKQTLEKLQALCQQKGLATDGSKATLSRRLNAFEEKATDTTKPITGTRQERQPEIFPATPTKTSYPCLHLKAQNLPNYFNFGYIYPLALEESEIYKNENREKDILARFPQYLVLSNGVINNFDQQDVLVELVLDNIEQISVEGHPLLLVGQPVPISRIKAIYFKTAAQLNQLLASVNTFQDSYIPSALCKVFSGEPPIISLDASALVLPANEQLTTWKSILARFDRLLGLFSFIKNTGLFYADKENQLDEYLKSYFGALLLINPVEELQSFKGNAYIRPLIFYRQLDITNDQRALFKLIFDKIYANETFSIKTAINALETVVTEKPHLDERAKFVESIDLFKDMERYTVSFKSLLTNEQVRRNIPLLNLLFLAKFSNKARSNSDKQAVRNLFMEEDFQLPLNTAEGILATLGAYYGYKNMVREDTNLTIKDRYFQQVGQQVQSIKFKMNTYLDRFTVESCFNFAKTETAVADSYPFLRWEDCYVPEVPITFSAEFEYTVRQNSVLQYKITSITRSSLLDKLLLDIEANWPEKIDNTSYLVTLLFKYLQLDRSYLIEQLRKQGHRIPIKELQDILELEKRNRKTRR